MNLADVSAAIWRRKWRTLLLALVSAAIAVAFTYQISFSTGLHPRALRFGVAQSDLLLDDAGQSPLAVSDTSLGFVARAADIAESTDSNFVVAAVAKALHVSPSAIGVQQQYVQDVPRLQYYSQEAQVGTQILSSQRKYQILARNDQGTFVIQLFTQAPTGRQAIIMAAAASHALAAHIARLGRDQRIPRASRLVLRQLAAPTGGTVDPHATRDAAILIGLIAWIMLMIASFTVDRARRIRRERLAPEAPQPAVSPA